MAKEWSSAYEFFYYYFAHNMDITKTLREYGLLVGKYNPAACSNTWRSLKIKYPEDYKTAKSDYLESIGITEPNLLILTYDLAQHALLDRDKLKAIDLLDRLMKTSSDSNILSASRSLTLNIIPPTDYSQNTSEEVTFRYEGDNGCN